MATPLVTVICTCFNHGLFVEEAIQSVLHQSYSPIQLIVVDNASTDDSKSIIVANVQKYPEILFLNHAVNAGHCKSFNEAIQKAKGKYLIDLAGDDVLTPDRIKQQVFCFEHAEEQVALIYSNAEEITPSGKHIRYSLPLQANPPQGAVFAFLLQKHFIPSPSTIFKAAVFKELGGYNEALAFEDFDFWVKCSRSYLFKYLPIVSVRKRILPKSLSSKFYSTKSDVMLASTFETFLWASKQIRTDEEQLFLNQGVAYYFKQAVLLGHWAMAEKFMQLIFKEKAHPMLHSLEGYLFKWRINLSPLYVLFHHLFH